MGQGTTWLTLPQTVSLLFLLLLLLLQPCTTGSWPTHTGQPTPQRTPCPDACICSAYSINSEQSAVCSGAQLVQLPPDLPTSLASLDVGGNRLTTLANLSVLKTLLFLDISNNNLTILGGEGLHNMTRLTTLNLSFNAIHTIKTDAFRNLDAIHTVDLAFNQLTSLNSNMLRGLENLEVLNLSRNVITSLSNQTFLHLHRLRVLDLSYNQLDHLPTDAFLGLDFVQTILLHDNKLLSITGAFNSLQQLTILDLSYNSVNALGNDTFTNLPQLDSLKLSFNNITDISPTFLQNAASLRILDLQGNLLETLQGGVFQNLPTLQKLDLSLMPYLQSMSFDALHGVQSLRFLNLSHNAHLSFLHPQLVASLPQLSVLDLRSNNLSLLSHITFHSNPSLSHLYLAHNPWHCGCGLVWLAQDMSNVNGSVVADISNVQCQLSDGTAVPISTGFQENMQCNNVSLVNVTDEVSAKIGAQLTLTCEYDADSTAVLTWTTPRGLIFHYHPFHPQAISHLAEVEEAENVSSDHHTQHRWHTDVEYDASLQHHPDRIMLQADGSLLIDFVLRSDAGPYRCMVHNSHHNASATITLLLDYNILFEVKVMSIVVGLVCATSFFTLNAVYVIIMWGARKLVNKRRRERIHKLLESLDEYRSTQILRIRTNYSNQLGRIREHYHTQSMRLKENYTTQMKRVRRGCSNQVERIRDNYHTRLTNLKEYSSHQIQQIREATNNQIIRIRDYGSLQMERLRETYKLQQQHVLKVIEAMNLENCRTIVETECMRTESMMFDINFPDLEEDNTSMEEASSQHSQNDSVYVTALNSDGSIEENMATVVEGGQDCSQGLVNNMTVEVLPSDLPADVAHDPVLSFPSHLDSLPEQPDSGESEADTDSVDTANSVRETVV